MAKLDDEFRQILTNNGYDVTQLGMPHAGEHKEEVSIETKKELAL